MWFWKNNNHNNADVLKELSALRKLVSNLINLDHIYTKERFNHMSQELDALTTEVAVVKTAADQAVAILTDLAAKLAVAGNDPVALQALTADLTATAKVLTDAVAANTPPTV